MKASPRLAQRFFSFKKLKLVSFLSFLALFVSLLPNFSVPLISHAQSSNLVGGISLAASSDNPSPGQQVTITATSYSSDLNSDTITWKVNGQQVQKGVGLTSISVTAPAIGKNSSISVTAVEPGGFVLASSLTLGSGSIDLITESDGYVPKTYLGKVPLVYENAVTIIAIPHLADSSGREYDPKQLVYQWKKDSGTVFQDQSGYGQQSITIAGSDVPRPYFIIVDVSTRDGSAKAEGLIQIAPQDASLGFYVNDPLYGPLFNRSVTNVVRIGSQKEVGILAVPFGFNKPVGGIGDLTLSWIINGVTQQGLSGNSIVLRAPDGQSGVSSIELQVGSTANILQSADSAFSAVFTATSTQASSPLIYNWIPVAQAANENYTLLTPLPALQGTGNCPSGQQGLICSINFRSFVVYAFNLFIALAAVAAVFMIVWGGFEYMTSSIPWQKNDGKEKIQNALIGLIMVLASYLILRTINPAFVNVPATLVPPLSLQNTTTNTTADFFNKLQSDEALYKSNDMASIAAVQAAQAQATQSQTQLDSVNQQIDAAMGGDTLQDYERDALCSGPNAGTSDVDQLCLQRDTLINNISDSKATAITQSFVGASNLALQNAANGANTDAGVTSSDIEAYLNDLKIGYNTALTNLQAINASAVDPATGNTQINTLNNQFAYAVGMLTIQQDVLKGSQADLKDIVTTVENGYAPTINDPNLRASLLNQVTLACNNSRTKCK